MAIGTRKLGSDGLEVSAQGLGCMGMSEFYGAADEAEATRPTCANPARRRCSGENFDRNLELVERVEEIAEKKGAAPGQLALAWVLAQGDDIASIPGTKHRHYLEQNVAASEIELSAEDLRRIDGAAPRGAAAGDRYADMSPVNR